MEENSISDEQADQLNNDDAVKAARLNLIRAMTESNANPTPENVEKAKQAGMAYSEAFHAKLFEVKEHPPQPKSVPVNDRRGFKR